MKSAKAGIRGGGGGRVSIAQEGCQEGEKEQPGKPQVDTWQTGPQLSMGLSKPRCREQQRKREAGGLRGSMAH